MICFYLTFAIGECMISARIMVKKHFQFNPYLLVIVSFVVITLIGSFLLCMPFAFRNNPNNEWCHVGNYLDALFTSLASMSLTGLTTYPEGFAATLSIAGQIIVLVLMQIGGLGIVTILTFVLTMFRDRIQFKNRLLISQAIAFNNFGEIVSFVRRLIAITLVCELVGFALGIPVFIQVFPNDFGHIIYYSLFYSISSFNNVGFDLFSSSNSLVNGLGNAIATNNWLYYYFTIYISILSLLGGIGFLIIIDIFLSHKSPRRWSAFTKIVLIISFGLIAFFTLCIMLSDGLKTNNPINFYQALMHTISCRTAGFAYYPLEEMSLPGRMITCLMMFIGGSPLSTAGGIKVTTIFVIIMSIISYFRGKNTAVFKRKYSDAMIAKSMSLVFIVLIVLIISFLGLVFFGINETEGYQLNENVKNNINEYYLFEVFSCFGNVGFFTSLEPCLSIGSKIILCLLMLLGHLGPMTFFQLLQNHLDKNANVHYSFVEEDFLIG